MPSGSSARHWSMMTRGCVTRLPTCWKAVRRPLQSRFQVRLAPKASLIAGWVTNLHRHGYLLRLGSPGHYRYAVAGKR